MAMGPEYCDKLFFCKSSGTQNSFTASFNSSLTIKPDWEIALISANIDGFKKKDFTNFGIHISNIDIESDNNGTLEKALYYHSGKWSTTEDNILAPKDPIYREMTNASDSTISGFSIEIRDNDTGSLVTQDATHAECFLTFHIRHRADKLLAYHQEQTKNSADSIDSSVQTMDLNVQAVNTSIGTLDTNVQAVNTSVQAMDTNVQAVNTSVQAMDTNVQAVNTSIGTLDASVDDVKASVDLVKTATDSVATNVLTVNTSIGTLDASVDDVKASVDLVKSATDSVATNVLTVNTSIGTLDASVDDVKASVDLVKTATDSVATNVSTVNTSIGTLDTSVNTVNSSIATLDTSVGLVKTAVDENKAQIRYKLIN